MSWVIVPMTRLGVVPYQSLPAVYCQLNRHLRAGKEILQLQKPVTLHSERFPEGHVFFPGSFLYREEECAFDGLVTDRLIGDATPDGAIRLKLAERIAFLNGKNCAAFCYEPFQQFFAAYDLDVTFLSDDEIRGGKLAEFDLLIVPGGPDAGESYYEGLGERGFSEIASFIARGGAYLGSCAGSYFPLTAPRQTVIEKAWLNLIPATDTEGLDYWRTGTGFVRVEFEEVNHPVAFGVAMGSPSTLDMIYWEGPAFEVLDPSQIKVIAKYGSFIASGAQPPAWDISNNPIAEEAMKWINPLTEERFNRHLAGRGAIIEASHGQGKLILFSPHAEFGACGTAPSAADSLPFMMLMNSVYYLSQ